MYNEALETSKQEFKLYVQSRLNVFVSVTSEGGHHQTFIHHLVSAVWCHVSEYLHPPNDSPGTTNCQFCILPFEHKTEKHSDFFNNNCENGSCCCIKEGKREEAEGK